jgi:hypothetical protein
MNSLHRLWAAALIVACAALLPAEDKKATDDGFKPLFNGKNLDGWVNVNCHPDTFFVKDNTIITTGKPTGFLRTDKQYENFVLEFDWMHVEKTKMANSGLFVWGDPLPAVGTGYTRGIEVQVLINFAPKDGWATSHGDIFSIWGAKCVPDRVHPVNPKMERCLPSENRVKGGGEWNHYKVTANDGAIKLEVNGKEVSGVSKCNPRKGYLALESEGAECHFKNIKIKELPSTNPKLEECAKVAEGHVSLFNGLDLTGWEPTAKDSWKLSDGVLRSDGKGMLLGKKEYGPFELSFDWKWPEKAPKGPNWFAISFSEGTVPNFNLTGLHALGNGRVGWKTTKWEPPLKPAVKPGTWARTVARFDGTTLELSTNGTPIYKAVTEGPRKADVLKFWPLEGLEIRNVFLRELKEKR